MRGRYLDGDVFWGKTMVFFKQSQTFFRLKVRSVGGMVGWSICSLVCLLVVWLGGCMGGWMGDWPIGYFVGQLIDWLDG